jgi:hypothetical protein
MAEALIADAAGRWRGEVVVLPPMERAWRCDTPSDAVTQAAAAAIWQAARTQHLLVDEITLCAAARWLREPLRGDLLHAASPPASQELLVRFRGGRPDDPQMGNTLRRASRALSCGHRDTGESEPGGGCARLSEHARRALGAERGLVWSTVELDGALWGLGPGWVHRGAVPALRGARAVDACPAGRRLGLAVGVVSLRERDRRRDR